jgi:putative colanic acid biosynthesis UDP-glucose lipid carrier transferase
MLPKGLLKEYSQTLSLVLRIMDIAAVIAAGLIAYFYKFGHLNLGSQYVTALCIASGLTLVIFALFHIYESVRAQPFWRYFIRLIQAIGVVLTLLAGLAFLSKTGNDFSRGWYMLWALFSLGLLMLFRCTLLIALRVMRSHGWNERRIIIVGAGEWGLRLINTLQQAHWTGFRIVAIFDDAIQDKPSSICDIPVMQTPDNIRNYLTSSPSMIDEIWIAMPLHAEARMKEILHELRHNTVTTRLVLDIFGMDLLNHSVTHLAGFPVINVRSTPMVGMNRLIKALEDRVLASLILLLLSPLLVLIALAIKCTSKGPVFYSQKRMSWNGKEFEMLKFRSMPNNIESDSGPVWAKEGEQRATKLGAFLRKTSLDELPQFINVVCGHMSIVGPRPERKFFVEQFKEQIPRYMEKHLVKAGITGWAQVNGWRGNTSLEKRIQYDLYYIENWSLALDVKIIFLTLFRGLVNKNAY